MLYLGNTFEITLYEEPYIVLLVIRLSPGLSSENRVELIAAMPDEKATAPLPTSKAAIFSSNSFSVGLLPLV